MSGLASPWQGLERHSLRLCRVLPFRLPYMACLLSSLIWAWLQDKVAGDSPVILFNLELDTLRYPMCFIVLKWHLHRDPVEASSGSTCTECLLAAYPYSGRRSCGALRHPTMAACRGLPAASLLCLAATCETLVWVHPPCGWACACLQSM